MAKLSEKELIEYVIKNGATLKQAAENFDVSLSTVKKTMKKVRDNLSENSDTYKELKEIAERNEALGKKKGGESHNSGSKRTLSLEEVSILAMKFIAENMTFSTASQKFGIPSSTLYDNFELLNCEEYQDIYNDLLCVYTCHNQNVEQWIASDVDTSQTFNSAWLQPVQYSSVIKLESLIQKYNLKIQELTKNKNR